VAIQKFLTKEKEIPTKEQASQERQKGKISTKATAMTTFVLFAPCRFHLSSHVKRVHAALLDFTSAKACFAVRLSR
jgi:hypothetical protein